MRNLSNIEKHPTRRGKYIGYADGAWRISKGGGQWMAVKQTGVGVLTARTLARMSQKLAMHKFQATIATVKEG